MVLLTNWSDAWLMTGIGVGVVFVILVILVLVLLVFNLVAKQSPKAGIVKADNGETTQSATDAGELDSVAVATAVYLYQKSKGDQESGILTIKKAPSAWHAVLNERL